MSIASDLRRLLDKKDEKITSLRAQVEELKDKLHDANTALDVGRTMLEKAQKQRDDLLARTHRDGGHYVQEHGLEKACADADLFVAELHGIRDAAVTLVRGVGPSDDRDGFWNRMDALRAAICSECWGLGGHRGGSLVHGFIVCPKCAPKEKSQPTKG